MTRGTLTGKTLAQQKLQAFEQLQSEFEASFRFVQHMHGQHRFASVAVAETVYYLHALWVCECKERLLSVHKNIGRYEGQYCLELLRGWQEGNTMAIVAFLQRKLDALSSTEIMHRIQEAQTMRHVDDGLLRLLVHGRLVLLNREMNLLLALDGIYALSDDNLMREVQFACSNYGHAPRQIEQQLAEVGDPLLSYAPHQFLAERNIQVMNTLGMNVMILPHDLPGERSWKAVAPSEPLRPFAETVIRGYMELTLTDCVATTDGRTNGHENSLPVQHRFAT